MISQKHFYLYFENISFQGQGILNSMGGGTVEFLSPTKNLIYNQPNIDEQNSTKKFGANDQGLIAFRQQSDLEKLLKVIHQ